MGVWWKWLNCLIIRGLLPAKRIPSLRVVPRTRILCSLALLQQLLHAKRKREGAIRTIEARRKRLRACGRRCVGAVHGRRCVGAVHGCRATARCMGVGAVYVVVLRLFLARSSKQKAVVNEQF